MRSARPATIVASLFLSALLVLSAAPSAFGQEGIAATLVVEGTPGASEMTITAQGDKLRMDMSAQQGNVSMVWLPDRMLMIMHPQQMYMELTEAMMSRMRGMMGDMSEDDPVEQPDPTQFSFERTGNTDTINGMDAYEVAVTGPEVEQNVMLWMTDDTDVGMFEVFAQMGTAMASMNMPMMNQEQNPTRALRDYADLARLQGMPDGRVIRVVNPRENVTITLQSSQSGPFGAGTFAAPEGYTKQTMPGMQR